MTAFLSCNHDYLDLVQCKKIDAEDVSLYVPSNILVEVAEDLDNDMAIRLQNIFSTASIDEEMKE